MLGFDIVYLFAKFDEFRLRLKGVRSKVYKTVIYKNYV